MNTQIYLASQSPRRRQLLDLLGVSHIPLDIDIDESAHPGEPITQLAVRLACEKAQAGFVHPLRTLSLPVLAADTLVFAHGRALGKPESDEEGMAMLRDLSGHMHEVFTGVAVLHKGRVSSALSISEVWFGKLSDRDIRDYWMTGEGRGKAGAYAIQGRASAFIERINGSFHAIMGLPLFETANLLRQLEK